MRKISFIIISVLIITSCGENKPSTSFVPICKINTVLSKQIDSIFTPYNENTPGYAVAIVQQGEIVFMKAYGMANPNKQIPITPDTPFQISSNSKQFTCMSILLLEEQGKLSINDPITKYLPELPDFAQRITIKQLMNHTSGIMEYNPLLILSGLNKQECELTNDDIIRLISKCPESSFNAGEHFFYTNSTYVLLTKIIEKASNQSYADFMQKNIFIPLGMKNSKVVTSKKDYLDGATGFEKRQGYRPANCQSLVSGARGIESTLYDMVKWINNYTGNQLGKKNQDLINRMETRGVLNNGDSIRYGLGLFIENCNGSKVIWHGGRETGFSSNITMIPKKQTFVIVLSNTMDRIPYKHRYDIVKVLFTDSIEFTDDPFTGNDLGKDILKSEDQTVRQVDLRDYEGLYGIDGFPKKINISVQDDALFAGIADMTFKLRMYATDVFIAEPMIFQFVKNENGLVSGFLLHGEKFRNLMLKRNIE